MLYVVFSATPLKLGSVIRRATGEKYNHSSISFDKNLKTLYSYARYHKKAPFYGGLVKEKAARYKNGCRVADIFVCAIPLTEEQMLLIKTKIEQMLSHSNLCRYNMLSASLALFSRRIFVPNCFTCIEFVTHIISEVCPEVSADKFYSIEDLRQILKKHVVYSGPFPDIQNETDEDYEKQISPINIVKLSLNSQKELLKAHIASKK